VAGCMLPTAGVTDLQVNTQGTSTVNTQFCYGSKLRLQIWPTGRSKGWLSFKTLKADAANAALLTGHQAASMAVTLMLLSMMSLQPLPLSHVPGALVAHLPVTCCSCSACLCSPPLTHTWPCVSCRRSCRWRCRNPRLQARARRTKAGWPGRAASGRPCKQIAAQV
jgi:hypothetical protein